VSKNFHGLKMDPVEFTSKHTVDCVCSSGILQVSVKYGSTVL